MGPDMVESFYGEELFSSEPFVCIVSEDQRFHMQINAMLVNCICVNSGSKDVQFVSIQGRK